MLGRVGLRSTWGRPGVLNAPHNRTGSRLRSAGLAVDLTAGTLGLHWWDLVGVGLVTLVIGRLTQRSGYGGRATPAPGNRRPKPSLLVSGKGRQRRLEAGSAGADDPSRHQKDGAQGRGSLRGLLA